MTLFTIDSSTLPNQKENDLTVRLNSPFPVLNGPYEVALYKANLWYSYYNISSSFNNHILTYTNAAAVTRTVIFENGNYTIPQINDYLHLYMASVGDFTIVSGSNVYNINITPDFSTLKTDISISGGYTLDLTTSFINELLGWDQAVYNTTGTGSRVANINRGINSILIRCSIVGGSYLNDLGSDIIFSFVPNVPPGANIEVQPQPALVYVPCNVNDYIRNIRIYITDQLGRSIDFNGEPITYVLYLRKSKVVPTLGAL